MYLFALAFPARQHQVSLTIDEGVSLRYYGIWSVTCLEFFDSRHHLLGMAGSIYNIFIKVASMGINIHIHADKSALNYIKEYTFAPRY
jgi:hypothetical protein